MIKSFFKIILSVFLIFTFFGISNYAFGANNQKSQYISLNPQSSSDDIKKFQKFFKALKIYKGSIDGKYSSIKTSIINFQIKNKIISNKEENGAGYIGPKTFAYFDNKYGPKFYRVYKKFFGIKKESFKNEKCFIVSAYYSPLPNQKRYSTKSYSGDIRLNGNGTHGASGAGVHPGFIAAPSNYTFGTKIQLDGLGVGVVEDRGGAIVRKGVRGHECDRLDIWMGYGDEGLNRALKWGKKKVSGKIVSESTKISISFPTETREYLAKKIKPESSKEDLKKMQELFSKAKLYSGKIDGKYESFKKSIINFQIKNKIIKNKNDYAAGYIGPKTIKKIEELYPEIFVIVRRKDIKNSEKIAKEEKQEKENKFGKIPEKKISKLKNTLVTKNNQINKILKKYSITLKQKQELDKASKTIIKLLKKKSGNSKNKFNKLKNKIKDNITKIIKKSKSNKSKKQLTYLKDILK